MNRLAPPRRVAALSTSPVREITPTRTAASRAAWLACVLAAVVLVPDNAAHARGGKPTPPLQAAAWGQGADAEEERFLLEGEIVEVRALGTGITQPKKVTLKLGDRVGHAVFKDVEEEYARQSTGTAHLEELYFSDRWQHEVAAYRIDRLVGLGLVPPTVERRIEGKAGSLQMWVEAAYEERERLARGKPIEDPERFARDSKRMFVFDALIYNVDRNQQNILVTDPGNRIWLIDHSRAFRLRRELPSPERGRKLDLRFDSEFLKSLLAPSDDAFQGALGDLLTKGQIKGVTARRQKLLSLAGESPAPAPPGAQP